jgi:alpha-beta hydrolase superfamily lysophospholipase
MKHSEESFTSQDGIKIYYQVWKPDTPAKAVVQVVHGLAEHGSRYMNVVNTLVPAGYAIYATDHRGHGKSEGLRGYVNKFNDFINDEKQLTEIIKEQEGSTPCFLLGHSMGSFISIHYASNFPEAFQGLVLSGTGTQTGEKVGAFLILMVRIFSKILPKGKINTGLSEAISRDPEVVKAYMDDPMVFPFITYRLGAELLKGTTELPTKISNIEMPILFQAGSDDQLVTGASDLFGCVTAADKTCKIYESLYHEVYNELEADRTIVLNDLKEWLNNHL